MKSRQYYMYGTIVSHDWYGEWNKQKGDVYLSGTTSDSLVDITSGDYITDDDISCIFYSRDGKSLIIGKILKEFTNDEAIIINELDDESKKEIELSVKNNYNLIREFNHYYIKTY